MGLVIMEILLQGDTSESRGNIEIDISSMESSSEVRVVMVVMCSRMFVCTRHAPVASTNHCDQ